MAGYAIECGIKACVAKQFRANSVPQKRLVQGFYQHNLEDLVSLAGLDQTLKETCKQDPEFEAKWSVVKDWEVDKRYEVRVARRKAIDLLDAIEDSKHGVLPWLRLHW